MNIKKYKNKILKTLKKIEIILPKQSSIKTIIASFIITIIASTLFFHYKYYNDIIKDRFINDGNYINEAIGKDGLKIDRSILIDIIKNENLKDIEQEKLLEYNKILNYNYVREHLLLTYYIYDKNNTILSDEELNSFVGVDGKILKLEKNDELAIQILKKSPYSYNMFPIFVFDSRDKTFENVSLKDDIKISGNYLYLNEKLQIFSSLFYLTDNIKKEVITFCQKDGLIIDNKNPEDVLLFIGKNSLGELFKNIKKLYSIDKNICYLDDYKYKTKEIDNKILELKEININKNNNKFIIDTSNENPISKYFSKKGGLYIFEGLNLIKIEQLNNHLN